MHKPISVLTYKVASYPGLPFIPDFDWRDCADWAYEMLILGYDTPNLVIVAGLNKYAEREEVLLYLIPALKELGIRELTDKESILCYAGFLIKSIAKAKDVRKNLSSLYKFYHNTHLQSIFDFCLLYWGWDELDRGVGYSIYPGEATYWPGATRENIEQIIADEAVKWLIDNKSMIPKL